MNEWLAAAVRYNGTFGENAKSAGTVTLLGMLTIFAVLALLWGVVQLLYLVMPKQKEKKPKTQTAEPKPVAEEPIEDDGAIVAAITAAILAARTEEGITTGFRVVSFKRTHPGKRTK